VLVIAAIVKLFQELQLLLSHYLQLRLALNYPIINRQDLFPLCLVHIEVELVVATLLGFHLGSHLLELLGLPFDLNDALPQHRSFLFEAFFFVFELQL